MRILGWKSAPAPVLCLGIALTGCAIDQVGLLASRVTRADGAAVIDVYQLGAYLRTRSEDAGVSFGYTQRTGVYPVDDTSAPEPGWYYFVAPLPERDAAVLEARTTGLEVRAVAPEPSITLGYRRTTILANVRGDENLAFRVTYDSRHPARTRLTFCSEEEHAPTAVDAC